MVLMLQQTTFSKTLIQNVINSKVPFLGASSIPECCAYSDSNNALIVIRGLVFFCRVFLHVGYAHLVCWLLPFLLARAVAREMSNLMAGEASSFLVVLVLFFSCHVPNVYSFGVFLLVVQLFLCSSA